MFLLFSAKFTAIKKWGMNEFQSEAGLNKGTKSNNVVRLSICNLLTRGQMLGDAHRG